MEAAAPRGIKWLLVPQPPAPQPLGCCREGPRPWPRRWRGGSAARGQPWRGRGALRAAPGRAAVCNARWEPPGTILHLPGGWGGARRARGRSLPLGKINPRCLRFMSEKETEESCNILRLQGESMGLFPWGLSNGCGMQPLFYAKFLATTVSSFSPLAEVFGRYRLPELPTLCPPLICTPLLASKRKKKKPFLMLLSLCCLALGSGI